ncbi:DUF4397 domain-containing protein [Herbiconiux sp. CPCC 205763]|uniref:DUF4397 domain-containing protein n=1 Tax=Herbiconiux aconitum TaxID=2970913 RepID=A0ABT2GUL9_9MICO|nr:DUF4397 domain-containing protein [Herbiconiux aconitum]MCS5719908.1 DUF4397 domain-containing protein [Herbiconiux aconitum]
MKTRKDHSRMNRLATTGAALAATLAFGAFGVVGVGASAAHADEPGNGWVRVAHLSPDTKSVDVKLTALSGGDLVSELSGVAYGAVSDYIEVPPGTYVVSMVPAGSAKSTAPMIRQSVNILSGRPVTVAAYGRNADLDTTVFSDDLTPPADGQARVRVIQASTTARSVDIATTTGVSVTKDAKQGTASGYSSVGAGPWTLSIVGDPATSRSRTSEAQIDLASGSVATLFVLDTANGGVTVKPVVDSASVGDLPTGGIQTGGGGTATEHVGTAAAAGTAGTPDATTGSLGGGTPFGAGNAVGVGALVLLFGVMGAAALHLRRSGRAGGTR